MKYDSEKAKKYYQNNKEKFELRYEANKQKYKDRVNALHERRRKGDLKTLLRIRLYAIRHKCKKNKIPFDLTLNDLLELYRRQSGKCYYSGIQLPLEMNVTSENIVKDNPHLPSIDRKVSSVGYIKGNVVICSFTVNSAKGTLSEDEFFSMIKNITLTHRL